MRGRPSRGAARRACCNANGQHLPQKCQAKSRASPCPYAGVLQGAGHPDLGLSRSRAAPAGRMVPSPGITRLFPTPQSRLGAAGTKDARLCKGPELISFCTGGETEAGVAPEHIPGCDLGTLLPPRPPTETTRPLHFIPGRLTAKNSKQAAMGQVSADARGRGQHKAARGSGSKGPGLAQLNPEINCSRPLEQTGARPSPHVHSCLHPRQGRKPQLP